MGILLFRTISYPKLTEKAFWSLLYNISLNKKKAIEETN